MEVREVTTKVEYEKVRKREMSLAGYEVFKKICREHQMLASVFIFNTYRNR